MRFAAAPVPFSLSHPLVAPLALPASAMHEIKCEGTRRDRDGEAPMGGWKGTNVADKLRSGLKEGKSRVGGSLKDARPVEGSTGV